MKKILIIIPSLEKGGGAEKNAYTLGRELSKYYETRYAKFYKTDKKEYTTQLFVYNLNENTNKTNLNKVYYIFKRIAYLKKIINEYNPNIIISFMFDANIITSLVSLRRRQYKVILSVRSDFFKQNRFKQIVSKYLYNRMDITHTITQKMNNILKQYGIKNTYMIYNGHNIEDYINKANEKLPIQIPHNKYIYLNIGRLHVAKGQWHLIKSFSIIAKENPNSLLIILGIGNLKDKLKLLIKKLDIEKQVLLYGNVDNIFPFIKRANCFCFTSLYEGMPNVLIEALSLNKFIVTVDCISGPREIICNNLDTEINISYPKECECGILTKPYKKKKIDLSDLISLEEIEYAEVMKKIMRSNKNCNNANLINKFDLENIVKQWLYLIESLMKD